MGSGFTSSQNVKRKQKKRCEVVKPDPEDYAYYIMEKDTIRKAEVYSDESFDNL